MYNLHLLRQYHDWMEKRRIEHEIRETAANIENGGYRSMAQADQLLTRLAQLIQQAREFNMRASTEPINTKSFTMLKAPLEEEVDALFLQGQLPLE